MLLRVVVILVLLLGTLSIFAAPAPLPRRDTTTEIVFNASTQERARTITLFLRSTGFPEMLWQDAEVRQLVGGTQDDRPRLPVAVIAVQDGHLIRLRLPGPRGRVTLARIIVARLTGEAKDSTTRESKLVALVLQTELDRRIASMKKMQQRIPGGRDRSDIEELEARLGRCELQIEPLKLERR